MRYVVVASKDVFDISKSKIGKFRAKSDDAARIKFIRDYDSNREYWHLYLALYRLPLLFPFRKRIFVTDND